MVTDDTLQKCGFLRDEDNFQLKDFFKNNIKVPLIHISIYSENPLSSSTPFMLLLGTSEKNATTSNDGNRLILKKSDKNKTYIMNVLFSKVTECFFKIAENYSEFILNIQNVFYRITILN